MSMRKMTQAAMAIFIPPDAPELSDVELAKMCAAGLLNTSEDDMVEAIYEGGLDLEEEGEGERERKKRKRREDFCPCNKRKIQGKFFIVKFILIT